MAKLQFDINGLAGTLFPQAFGVNRGKPFDSNQAQEPTIREEAAFEDLPESNDDEGTEFVNMRNSLQAVNPLTGKAYFMPIRLGGVLLPNEPTIVITGRKNILETPLVGSTRKGTVKELISIEDYDITIRGIAINLKSKLVYPEDEVKGLNDLFNLNESLSIECALTNLFGIYRLVIKQVSFPEMRGVQHAQAFEFNCVSDEDFILELQ